MKATRGDAKRSEVTQWEGTLGLRAITQVQCCEQGVIRVEYTVERHKFARKSSGITRYGLVT